MNIYVSNLSYQITEDSLREIFEEYGEVSSAKIITDKSNGRSRGFGFVEMENEEDAQQAINNLNNKEIDGRNISVNVARPRTENGNSNRGNNRSRNSFGGGRRY